MNLKQIMDDWGEYLKAITESTTIDDNEPEEVQRRRKARLEAYPEEWFKYYFPRYAFAEPARFHKDATERVLGNPEHYEVRMWSRELAKSTRTMMEVLYLMLVGYEVPATGIITESGKGMTVTANVRKRKRYALMISNSQDNAIRLLMPYKANLEANHRIIQDYGEQVSSGKWQAGEFTTLGGASFRALGAGQSPRGTRNEEIRPDMLLFDDVDTDADCLNPETVARKWRWIEEAAIGTRSVSQPTTIIFCGNRIAVNCCVQLASAFADHTDEVHIRDAEGRSSWPQKNSEADIDRVQSQKSYAAWQKEYYNNPIVEGAVFGQMAYKPMRPLGEYECLVCYTDPSYTDTNDYKATVLVGVWEREYHVIKCFVDQTTTDRMIDWLLQLMDMTDGYRCHFYMEDVFIQDVLVKQVNERAAALKKTLRVMGDKRSKPNKYTRIEATLELLHRDGRLYLNEREKGNPHMVKLEQQFTAFAPGSNAHDDAPDAVEGAVWLIDTLKMKRGERLINTVRSVRDDARYL